MPLEYDQRLAARDRVVDAHLFVVTATSYSQFTRRRVRKDRQRPHNRANADHGRRFTTSDRVERAPFHNTHKQAEAHPSLVPRRPPANTL